MERLEGISRVMAMLKLMWEGGVVWVITALIWSGGYPVYKGVNIWEQKTAEPQLTSNIPWNRQYQVADGPFPLGARLATDGRSAGHLHKCLWQRDKNQVMTCFMFPVISNSTSMQLPYCLSPTNFFIFTHLSSLPKTWLETPHPFTIFATILDWQEEWEYFAIATLWQDLKFHIEQFSGVWKTLDFKLLCYFHNLTSLC